MLMTMICFPHPYGLKHHQPRDALTKDQWHFISTAVNCFFFFSSDPSMFTFLDDIVKFQASTYIKLRHANVAVVK